MHDHDYSAVQEMVINSGLLVCGIVYTCLVGQHCYVKKLFIVLRQCLTNDFF